MHGHKNSKSQYLSSVNEQFSGEDDQMLSKKEV